MCFLGVVAEARQVAGQEDGQAAEKLSGQLPQAERAARARVQQAPPVASRRERGQIGDLRLSRQGETERYFSSFYFYLLSVRVFFSIR